MINLFPVPIAKGRIVPTPEERAETDALFDEIFAQVSPGTWGGETGLSSGEISLLLHQSGKLNWLLSPLHEQIYKFWDTLNYVPVKDIFVESCWVNKHGKGDMTREHSHTGGAAGVHIASVFYYQKTDGNSDIEFVDPLDYIRRLTPLRGDIKDELLGESVHTEQYDYLIFPAWVRHRVSPNPVDHDRIAISVNWVGGL